MAGLLVLRVVAPFVRSNWLWGVDLGRYFPLPLAVALFLVAAAGFVPGLSRRIDAAIERLGVAWERAGRPADLLLGLAVGVALFALRDSLRFTGDFDLRVSAIDYPKPPAQLFPQASFLDVMANFQIPRLLLSRGFSPAMALQAVGATLGAAFTVASLGMLRSAGARGAALPVAAAVVLAGGYMQHFAGYDKFGPLLLGIALASGGAVSLERAGRGAWSLVAGAALCLLAHRSGYLLLPAAYWVLARALKHSEGRRRAGLLWAGAALLVVSLLLLPAAISTLVRVDWSVHLPGGSVARSFESPDAPGFVVRFSDLLNALLFLAPLCPLGLVMAWAGQPRLAQVPQRPRRSRLGLAATLALAVPALTLIAVGATRGSGRDWDAAASVGVLATLASAVALIPAWRIRGPLPLAAPCVTLSLAVALLAWGPHVNEAIGLRRVRGLLEAHPAWSNAARAHALDFLGLRALVAGRNDEAAVDFERAIAVAPNPRYFHELGLARLGAGRHEVARTAFLRSTALAPTVADSWFSLAQLALAQRDTLAAIAYSDSGLLRRPTDAQGAALRRSLATARGSSPP